VSRTRYLRAAALYITICKLAVSALGLAHPARADLVDLHLYGNSTGANKGWGKDPGNITNPGPYLTYPNGTQLRLTLYSQDARTHNFFVDYNGDRNNASEPSTGSFSSSSGTTFPPITLNRTGNFTYRCIFHTTMTGTINITAAIGGTVVIGGFPISMNLIIVLGIVAAVAIAFLVVFRRSRRRRPPLGEEVDTPTGRMPRSPR
jgi:heme/copper-type cytochrome/quinol oxidase subunit 2